MYSLRVGLILAGMIFTGALRSVAVKVLFQLGFRDPLFVTLLYLIGQSLSLAVHAIFVHSHRRPLCFRSFESMYIALEPRGPADVDDAEDQGIEVAENGDCSRRRETNGNDRDTETTEAASVAEELPNDHQGLVNNYDVRRESSDDFLESPAEAMQSLSTTMIASSLKCPSSSRYEPLHNAPVEQGESSPPDQDSGEACTQDDTNYEHRNLSSIQSDRTHRRHGSRTGLDEESYRAAGWAHRIPWHLKPAVPGLLSMCNAALRWGSLVFVPASAAEMLISGLELVLSVVAARVLRKRLVSVTRWGGVFVVAVGIVLVGLADAVVEEEEERDEEHNADGVDKEVSSVSSRNFLIGNALIAGQCVLSVLQDLAEEVFLQETDMSATLLLGMEGIYGLLFGLPLYFVVAPRVGEAPLVETWTAFTSDLFKGGYVVGLVLLVLMTGIFNIVATEVTSSMTRNVWKNFRTVLVWALGLVLYYVGGNDNLGEEWALPGSFYTLGGFLVMTLGTFVYYTDRCDMSITVMGVWQRCRCIFSSISAVTI